MPELIESGLHAVLDPAVWLAVLAGVPIGLVFGLLPGLGGITALAMLLPFIYGMEPMTALAFLLSAHAVVYTGGSLTAIVLGIPGAPPNAATVMDGFALSRQGRTGFAIGAALAASGAGGILGFAVLLGLLPFLQPLLTSFGSPETFLLSLLGITYLAVLGSGAMLRGLIAGGSGVFLALFGYQAITGVPRFWFGVDYLLDGFRLVPLVLGLFAVPEILALSAGRAVAGASSLAALPRGQVWEGVRATARFRWLCLRSSVIGVLVGVVPGLGGETAPFIAYASAKQTAGEDARFGEGAIEGVIAPESSNNAKEGGALIPTLALGIPGSAGMAVLLGGFLLVGLEPGPNFLATHMDVAVGLAVVLVLANVLGVLLMLALSKWLARIALANGVVLAPILSVLVVLGAYASNNEPADVLMVFAFGALGCVLKALGYSRPALLLGFVLGGSIETYLHISWQAYGPAFVLRPVALALVVLIVSGLCWPWLRSRRVGVSSPAAAPRPRSPASGGGNLQSTAKLLAPMGERLFPVGIAASMAALLGLGVFYFHYSGLVLGFPLIVGLATGALCAIRATNATGSSARHADPTAREADRPPESLARLVFRALSLSTLVPATYLLGYPLGLSLFLLLYLKLRGQSWQLAAGYALLCLAVAYGLFMRLLGVPLPTGPL